MITRIAASLLATAMMVAPALAAETAPAPAGSPVTKTASGKADAKSGPQVASAKKHTRTHRHHAHHKGKKAEAKSPAPTK